MIGLIWAQAANGVIGRDGTVPWRLPEDLAHFRAVTAGSTVVMGRRTWDSLPPRFRPLPGRRNLVLSRQPGWSAPGAEPFTTLPAALAAAATGPVWVVGGAAVYAAALPLADVLEVTELAEPVDGDTRAPAVGHGWERSATDPATGWSRSATGWQYRFTRWTRVGGLSPAAAPGSRG